MKNIKVLIVEDRKRDAVDISRLIENLTGFEIISVIKSQKEFEIKAHNLKPDLIIMDLYLPEERGGSIDYSYMNLRGLKIGNSFKAKFPEVGIIFTTILPSKTIIETIKKNDVAGGLGFVHKDSSDEVIIAAVKEVSSGRRYFDDYEFARNNSSNLFCDEIKNIFNNNEIETLRGIANSLSDEEIGKCISLGKRRVGDFKKSIKEKLENHQICIGRHKTKEEYTNVDLAHLALRLGLANLLPLEK